MWFAIMIHTLTYILKNYSKFLLDILKARYEIKECDSHHTKLIEQSILKFTLVLQKLRTKSSGNNIRFIQANSECLNCNLNYFHL